MKHKHADLMMQYAQDAMTSQEPWLLWEILIDGEIWSTCAQNPEWNEDTEYRRKKRTININGNDVPEPIRHRLKKGERYYLVNVHRYSNADSWVWEDSECDAELLDLGVIHLTQEAADMHIKALQSFTRVAG